VLRIAALLAAVAACYAPSAQPGSPCHDTPCPSDLVCSPVTRRCELPGGGDLPDGGGGDGGGGDAPAQRCFGTGLLKLCLAEPPRQPVTLGGGTFNTDTSVACVPYDGTGLCVVAGTDVSIGGTVRVIGGRPLVLIAAGELAVAGDLDAASRRTGFTGAGAASGPAACGLPGLPTLKGGGPGGSFGGRGGDGGVGEGGGSAPAVTPSASVTALRGGCPGRAGVGTTPGAGGAGGGAVYLIAAGQIGITGSINASGAGGGGAQLEGGGGGGGAGGMIGLDAPSVLVIGDVFANGGGGGEGGGAATGNPGADPAAPKIAAPGGANGAPNGGDGGNGAAGAILTGGRGGDNTNTAGGGGGGGGAGVIVVYGGMSVVGDISPPPR
jgi:hypothetical protein